MLELHRILVSTDLSECSHAAFGPASALAAAYRAELHVVHVETLHSDPQPDLRATGEFDPPTEAALTEATSGVPVVRSIARGIAAAPTLMDYAEAEDCDCIAIGSHGRRGLRRFILGSVSEEVLRGSGRPVLVVPSSGRAVTPESGFERILVPLDFSDATEKAVQQALWLASAVDAYIDLTHVVDVPVYPDFYLPVSMAQMDPGPTGEAARERLERILSTVPDPYRGNAYVEVGRPAPRACELAESLATDLILIPSHGYRGWREYLLGGTAREVVRHAPCPTLVFKPFGEPS